MKPAARHRARECAIQALYCWQLSGNEIVDIENQFLNDQPFLAVEAKQKTDISYFRELLAGVSSNFASLDAMMAPYLSRDLQELGAVEKAILRLAVYELAKRADVPYRVAINEAVELAKAFGATDSHKFINGVLDKVAPVIRPLKK